VSKITKIETAKIMVSLATPLIERLNNKIEKIGLRRDSYLGRLLEIELPRLNSELGKSCNSDAGKKYLWSELQKLPRSSVSITLNKSVIEKLGVVCEKHNIDRDCLLNRIIFFLGAENKHLRKVGLDYSRVPLTVDLVEDSANPFDQVNELINEPFFRIRQWMEESGEGCTFYLWSLEERGLGGLDCVIDDQAIPEIGSLESIA
jgi:hypothetical protein